MNVRRLEKWLPEIDDRRWITREGKPVMFVIWQYRGYVKLYPFWDHWLLNSWYESWNWGQRWRYMMYWWPISTGIRLGNSKLRNNNAEWESDWASANPTYTNVSAKISFQINNVRSRMKLVISGATTFKPEGNNHTGVKNPYHELSTYQRCWNEAPQSAFTNRDGQQLQAHQGTIIKLDSGNGDDLSEISWIHAIGRIHKADSTVSPQWPAHLEMNREAQREHSWQPDLTRYAPAKWLEVNKRNGVNRTPEGGWTKHSHCSEVEFEVEDIGTSDTKDDRSRKQKVCRQRASRTNVCVESRRDYD